jgi:hypothetical protein
MVLSNTYVLAQSKRQRNPKGQSEMDNQKTLSILVTRHTTLTKQNKNKTQHNTGN